MGNYYWEHKEKNEKKQQLESWLQQKKEEMETEIQSILGVYQEEREEEIKQALSMFEGNCSNITYEWDQTHICKVKRTVVTFEIHPEYSNIEGLKEFYQRNKEIYRIVDEYGTEVDFKTFLKDITKYKDDWVSYSFF